MIEKMVLPGLFLFAYGSNLDSGRMRMPNRAPLCPFLGSILA